MFCISHKIIMFTKEMFKFHGICITGNLIRSCQNLDAQLSVDAIQIVVFFSISNYFFLKMKGVSLYIEKQEHISDVF